MRAAHLWQMLLNALFTSHLVRLIIGGRGKGHYFSLSLRGALRLLSFSPLSPPPPCNAPKKFFAIFFFLRPLSSPPLSLPLCQEPLREGGLGAVPPSKDPALPPGSSPCSQRLYPRSSKCCRVMVPQRGRARLPRPRCSLDAPSPLSGRQSRGSAAPPGRHKPAYSRRASAQMKFQ